MEQRTAYRSAFRNYRAPVKNKTVPEVGGPAGARTSTTAQDQAEALRRRGGSGGSVSFPGGVRGPTPTLGGAPAAPSPSILPFLPREIQAQIAGGYQTGGFEGISNTIGPEWFDIPEHIRTGILKQVSGR